MSKKLEILKQSLIKKEAILESKFESHFADVKSANGQPLNDKRNGQATINRWEKQNNSIRNQIKEVEKTKEAILKEEYKIEATQEVKDRLPQFILDKIEDGTIIQWRKHPEFFFVKGVEKARILWRDGILYHRYVSEIPKSTGQYEIFRDVFNGLNADLRKSSNK